MVIQKQQLKKAIEKQKEFQDGKTKKTKISKALNKQMKAMENSGVEIKDVEYDNVVQSVDAVGLFKN